MAYRWFLNLSLTGTVPSYSTFSKNYSRRYESSDVFDKIFNTILESLIDNNLIDTSIIFVDGTHIKANANKKKFIKKAVNVEFTKFEKEIQKEIKAYRKEIGRKDDDNDDDENIDIDEELDEAKGKKAKKKKQKLLNPADIPRDPEEEELLMEETDDEETTEETAEEAGTEEADATETTEETSEETEA